MSQDIPEKLKYTKEHEWIAQNDDGSVTVGITLHAQSQLGDVVFVELPEIDTVYEKDDEAGTVESVKAVAEVYMPLKGQVISINNQLDDQPELVNDSPYQDGWFFKVKLDNQDSLSELLSPEEYAKLVEEE